MPPEELTRIQVQTSALEAVRVLQGLSTPEKLRTLGEWRKSVWFGWAVITLLKLEKQAESFSQMPPDGIEGLVKREQALGEINGLRRFLIEVQETHAALEELHKEEIEQPKEEQRED